MNLRYNIARIAAGVLSTFLLISPSVVNAAEADTTQRNDIEYTYSTGTGEMGSEDGITSKTWERLSDTTWTMDIDGDGTVDVTLEEVINDDGEQEWTYTFNVVDDETAYYVYEEMTRNGALPLKDGYTSIGSDSTEDKTVSAIPQDPGKVDEETKDYTIRNKKDHTTPGTGTLRLTKVVSNPESMMNPQESFLFEITIRLEGGTAAAKEAIAGTKVFGDTAFKDGVARVSLKAGESIDITGLPEGVTYTVTETVPSGYELTGKVGDTGAIVADSTSEATFTNTSTYTPPPSRETTSFQLVKKAKDTTGGDAAGDAYTFNIQFEGLDPYMEITGTLVSGESESAETVTATADQSGYANMEVQLCADQVMRVSGIPVGATYQVIEAAGTYTSQYEITNASEQGSIAQSSGTAALGNGLATGKETAESGEDITITYTNTVEAYQDLVLVKNSVTADGEADTADKTQYAITVSFSGLKAGYKVHSSSGSLTANADGEAGSTLYLGAGDQVVFYSLPVGTQYQFTEAANDKIGSYVISADMAGTLESDAPSGANKTADTDIATGVERVDKGEDATVTFTNKTPRSALLQVIKYEGTADAASDKKVGGAEFALYTADGTAVNYTTDENGAPSNVIVIGENGESEILESDLFVAGDYYLVETKAPEGYAYGSSELSFTITNKDMGVVLQIKAYDDQLVVLPVTGGEGRYGVYIAAAMLAVFAAMMFAVRTMRQRRAGQWLD